MTLTDGARAKRVLLLSVSAGAGHVRAAEALRVAAETEFGATAKHLDVMDHVPSAFRAVYADLYLHLIERFPLLWAQLYRVTDQTPRNAPIQKLRRAIERLNTGSLRKAIAAFAPDAIIVTHFLPAELLARECARGRIACPVWVQVTDFDLHALWAAPGLAGYCAANDEVAYRMRARGLPDERVHATGIPIMPAFATPLDRAACAAELGFDPQRPTVLLMGGGAGVGALDRTAEHLLALPGDFQIAALAGRNADLLSRLRTLAARVPSRLFAFGFTDRIERLMAASDLAVTKPGGLTTSECLALGLPMIVHAPIPGQEERNCDFLLESGAGVKAVDLTALAYRVATLFGDRPRLARMAAAARALGRPAAARDVLRLVLPPGG
jgi:processive 1,2-diacylglycerol beta-glucosyltransferase